MSIAIRKSSDRGLADHGWLLSKHTFSFANYYDSSFNNFGSLRVINEDLVQPGSGFPSHGHKNYEIFSYIVSGALSHTDSMGNSEIIERGGVQFTSAGSGIRHSEYNKHNTNPVHFIQIWIAPNKTNTKPYYKTQTYTDSQKTNTLCPIVGGTSPVPITQDASVFASILLPDAQVQYTVPKKRQVYIHVTESESYKKGQIQINGKWLLNIGDGAFVKPKDGDVQLDIKGIQGAEFLLFDVAQQVDFDAE